MFVNNSRVEATKQIEEVKKMVDYYQFEFECRKCGSFGIKLIEEEMKNVREERN